jgi:tRNA dimethylallyltransferase
VSRTPALVAVVGPTASGKSAVALEAARLRHHVELISVDSMQVYRGMDIGTAKPSAADQAEVRHHLIDLVEPDHDFAVAEFQVAYRAAVSEIAGRGAAGILVGGTGLYHRAAIDDLDLPGEWPSIRSRLETEAAQLGPAALHARLATLDPAAAAKIEPSNQRRIVRALEVCEGSGRRFSSFGPGLHTYPASTIAQIGLRWHRAALAARIEQRVHAMVDAGLVDEVAQLLARGMSPTARQALGYKELIDHIDGRLTLDAAVELIVVRTRQFAVRQLRWFQRDPRLRWVDVDGDPVAAATPAVLDALERCTP